MKQDLVIYGAGGLGREILSLIQRDYEDKWDILGFIDDAYEENSYVDRIPVLSKSYLNLEGRKELAVILAINDPNVKKNIYTSIKNIINLVFPKIISKNAIINNNSHIKEGSVITDNCWISTNVNIGNFCFLNVGNVIGHDVKIGDFSSLMPLSSISGFVEIGKCALVGAKSFILQGLSIGENCVVGAGCSLFSSLKDGETAITNPPHIIKCKC